MRRDMFVLVLAPVLIAGLISGCGRKGPLEAPPGATTQQSGAEEQVPVNQRRDLPGAAESIMGDSHGGAGP